jgi:hypothetical protein
MTAPAKSLNGNTRMACATMAGERSKALEKENAEIVTRLRKNILEIATLRAIAAVAGVETIDADEPEPKETL